VKVDIDVYHLLHDRCELAAHVHAAATEGEVHRAQQDHPPQQLQVQRHHRDRYCEEAYEVRVWLPSVSQAEGDEDVSIMQKVRLYSAAAT